MSRISALLFLTGLCCLPFVAGCGPSDPRSSFDPATASVEQQIVHAVKTGDLETVKGFMADEPELALMYDSTGKTLLHHAAVNSQVEMARYLLDNSADINAQGSRMETPLDDAIGAEASPEMIKFLEDNGGHD